MTAGDFLDGRKHRLFRAVFPLFWRNDANPLSLDIFWIDDANPFLQDVNFHEVFSSSPEMETGNLVIPELTLKTAYTDMKSSLNQKIRAESGIETNREDVTEELLAMQEYFTEKFYPVRSASGDWLIVSGNWLYTMRPGNIPHKSLELGQEVKGIWLEEEYSQNNNIFGKIYLLHKTAPFLTSVGYQRNLIISQYAFWAEKDEEIPENLYHELLEAGTLSGSTSITFSQNDRHVQRLHQHVIRHYDSRDSILSGEITDFEMKSYGDLILKEINFQAEETMEILCYGILEQTVAKNAKGFLRTLRNAEYATLAECYQGFLAWLNSNGVAVSAAEQEFLNLEHLPFVQLDTSVDINGITAGMLLKEFAALEGGNARINRENQLELGWCRTEPVLTLSTEVLESMQIGTERLAAAEGVFSLNPDSQNYIRTARNQEDMILPLVTSPEAFAEACQRIVSSTAEFFSLPFSVSALEGASPFIQAGDCIRILTRSNCAISVPVMIQEIRNFPFLQSQISMPDATDWATIPIDFARMRVTAITASNFPLIIYDVIPDFSDMIISVHTSGEDFTVPPPLCEISVDYSEGLNLVADVTVSFAGKRYNRHTPYRYALRTTEYYPFLTSDNKILGVKEMHSS